jgi:hypothetical protein
VLPLFEIAFLLVGFDHVARFIVNADHSLMRPTVEVRLTDALLPAFGSTYHSPPNGSASEIRSRHDDLYGADLEKVSATRRTDVSSRKSYLSGRNRR